MRIVSSAEIRSISGSRTLLCRWDGVVLVYESVVGIARSPDAVTSVIGIKT